MKYLSLLLAAALTSTVQADDVPDSILANQTVVLSDPFAESVICPGMVNRTYKEFYDDNAYMKSDGGACGCLKKDDFMVTCGFYYCPSCYNGFCIASADSYGFPGTGYTDTTKVADYRKEYLFMYEPIPFTDYDALGNPVNEGNWTELVFHKNSTACQVVAIDDADEETQMCTCKELECASGNTTVTQTFFSCTQNRTWGNCNVTQDTFHPDNLTLADPLVVLNEKFFSWDSCFQQPV